MSGFTHESHLSKTVDWYTPPWIFDKLGLIFDLDPCQPVSGVFWIPALKRYTEIEDGLSQPWEGRVWLNPPYGKYNYKWLEKMNSHRNGVAIVFSRTDCAWFHDFVTKADAILFLKGRVRFVDGLGSTKGSGAGSGSMLVAWGVENVEALKGMKSFGYLVMS